MAATIVQAWDDTIKAIVGIGYAVLHKDHVYLCLKCRARGISARLKVFGEGHDGHPAHFEHRKHDPACEDCTKQGAYSPHRKPRKPEQPSP